MMILMIITGRASLGARARGRRRTSTRTPTRAWGTSYVYCTCTCISMCICIWVDVYVCICTRGSRGAEMGWRVQEYRAVPRKGGWYGWKPSAISNCSIRVFRAYLLIEITQAVPNRATRGNGVSVKSPLPPLCITCTRYCVSITRYCYLVVSLSCVILLLVLIFPLLLIC